MQLLSLTALLAMLSPLTPAAPAARSARAPVTVVATDYHLALPATLPAGATTFRLVNHGREPHHLLLVRLLDGKSPADLVAALKAGGPPPGWAVFAGGPNAVDPGGTSLATTVPLVAGRYAALCIVPGPDGVPHVMKGMVTELTVTAAVTPASAPPRPSVTVSLIDYGFRTSAPITSATRSVRVENAAHQAHELVLVRMLPGKSAEDMAEWAEHMAGPPPAHFLGGASPIAPGDHNDLSLHLAPGRYALLCFVPDAHDGKPHTAHGMVHELVVK